VQILFLGGTKFLGRHAAGVALERGHDVTLFHRGSGADDPYPEAEHLHGDRDGGLDLLRGRHWDAVVDTSGYVPRAVRRSVELLSDNVEHYTFVSTCSVYSDLGSGRTAEDGKLHEPPVDSEDVAEHYGGLKVGCERVVEERFAGRSFIPRPGLIVGPYDPTDRFTYWVRRIADGGRVLAPGSPDAEVELIDARDLAAWMLDMAESNRTGIYNAVGPDRVLTMGEMLETCREAAGSDAELVWVDEQFLLDRGVQPWTELPVWLPSSDPEAGGFSTFDASKAIAAGLTFRALIETARDTLAWHRDVMDGRPAREGAISREREAQLLAEWRS
jgi:nucleoside-diphosphate-sugar epimerase